jgi:hypothetical protein
MFSRVSRASTAALRKVRLAANRATDLLAERRWERRRLSTYQPLDEGEVTALLHRMGAPGLNEYAAQQRAAVRRRSFIPTDRDALITRIDTDFPWVRRQSLEAADRVREGRFDVLGSGIVDLRRDGRGGSSLDWNRDLRTGARYPERFSHWRAAVPKTLARVHGDIKGPWEIGRCQHFAVLGQAYWFTGDERYAETFTETVLDFLERNPPGCGVQWTCTMDVALRAVGWLTGLAFFDGAPALTAAWWKAFLTSLVEHGRFIAGNLEFGTLDGRIVTSNHYVANLLGLCWISNSFPELDTNNAWRGLAEYGLEREIASQIHPDGGSFESSVPYQRLVVEMFLSAYAISAWHGRPFSRAYRGRLIASLSFIRALRQPGGRMPQVGDCDNGRAHILTGYGVWSQESMDHLLAAGARVLNCPTLAEGIDDHAAAEAAFWDVADAERCTVDPPRPIALFPQSGLAVLRNAATTVVFTNGPVGTEGFGNHKHCDQLAIEICVGAQPVFVDAGSYVYTSAPDERNRFRGTAIHNTVMIDGEEQHGLNREWLFRLFQQGDATFVQSGDDGREVFARARHTAYARLDPPVVHERRVAIGAGGEVGIQDFFDRTDGHRFRWHFLLHSDVTAERIGAGFRLTWPNGGADFSGAIPLEVVDGWYSPSYGIRRKASALVAEVTQPPACTTFALRPMNAHV